MKEFKIAENIDHTLLRADAGAADIDKLCDEAIEYGFASDCVNSCWVQRCAQRLSGSGVKVCTVAGFPLGACAADVKIYEAASAVLVGADEVDMVMNVGAMKDGNFDYVKSEIAEVVSAVKEAGKSVSKTPLVKVILETCLLSDPEKAKACELARDAGADFVKTSTGFGGGGATVLDVCLLNDVVGGQMGIKAAGGIRTYFNAVSMLDAGATRLGCSASVDIIKEEQSYEDEE